MLLAEVSTKPDEMFAFRCIISCIYNLTVVERLCLYFCHTSKGFYPLQCQTFDLENNVDSCLSARASAAPTTSRTDEEEPGGSAQGAGGEETCV